MRNCVTPKTVPKQLSFFQTFSRSQISSVVATAADFGVLFALVEFLGVWYVAATAIGSVVGALANFLINRHWSFEATHGKITGQAFRYGVVSAGSLGLNTGGVYLLTDFGKIHYALSVLGVSIAVGFVFNFPLHRQYVFR